MRVGLVERALAVSVLLIIGLIIGIKNRGHVIHLDHDFDQDKNRH